MTDLRKYSRKSAKELRQIIGDLLVQNEQLEVDLEAARLRLEEVAPSIDNSSMEYVAKWTCPACGERNEEEFDGVVDLRSLHSEEIVCGSCDVRVWVNDR